MKYLSLFLFICVVMIVASCASTECPENFVGTYIGNDECGTDIYQNKEVTLTQTGDTYELTGWYDVEGLAKDGCALYLPSPFESFGERYVVSLFEDAIRIDQIDVSTGENICAYVGDR